MLSWKFGTRISDGDVGGVGPQRQPADGGGAGGARADRCLAALKELNRGIKSAKTSVGRPPTLYRAMSDIYVKVGQKLVFKSFTSTSTDKVQAGKYMPKDGTGVLLIFSKWKYGKSMKVLAECPAEEEVLLAPYQRFVVTHFDKENVTHVDETSGIKSTKAVTAIFLELDTGSTSELDGSMGALKI
jgi:hypothetical protein